MYLSLVNKHIPFQEFVLVDYGGGSGVFSYLASELGIGTVIYTDIYDVSCRDALYFSSVLNLPLEHIVCGDLNELIVYVKDQQLSVNCIVSFDVIEHIYEIESHISSLSLLSGSGLRIVYGSGANQKNPRQAFIIRKLQLIDEYENRTRQWGHKERDTLKAFYDIRKGIISDYDNGLTLSEISFLAKSTRGLIKSDIEKCVDEYKNSGLITYKPNHPTNTCDPLTGNWSEHLMDTSWLEELFNSAGFETVTLSGYYSLTGNIVKTTIQRVLNGFIKLLRKQALILAPYYIIVANKAVR
jgi:hypothetical protein